MKRTLLLIGGGVVLIFSLLFGAYVAFGPFQPEEEVRRMLTAMSQLETVEQSSAISWTRGEARNERETTTVYVEGGVRSQDEEVVEHATRFRVIRIRQAERTGDLQGEIRHVNDETFLTYAPPGPEVDGVVFDEERVWVSFNPGQLPAWGTLLPGASPPLFDEEVSKQAWSGERIRATRNLLSRADIFDVEFNNLTTFIGTERTRIFDARFNPQALRAFLFEYHRTKTGAEELSKDDRIRLEQTAAALERLTVRMWIGADTHYLHKIRMTGAVPEEPGGETLVPADVVVKFSAFNEPVEISGPSDTVTFDQVVQKGFGGLPAEGEGPEVLSPDDPLVSGEQAKLPVAETEQVTDTDGDGLDDATEAFFGTDAENPDTDGDGVSDGEEVSNGKNPSGPGPLFGFGLTE